MNILVIDDDPITVELLRDALLDAGHQVCSASDGNEGLACLTRQTFHLVITDWEMPGCNGPEVCRTIRSGSAGQVGSGYCYLVLLTSHDGREQRIEGLSAGADDFLSKPFDRDELIARLHSAERIVSLETRDVAIFAMAKLAESRDTDTGAHLERVQSYARCLTQHLISAGHHADVLDAEYLRLIHSTSPLHDIGKVGIPDSVLLKPGRLTAAEFAVMRTHTTLGADTLAAAAERFPGAAFLEMARDIAATHHEKFDGTGYPLGLAGEEIPLCGRIVALADVYDALTSKRVYKDAFSHATARKVLLQDSGSHFDPQVVEAFLATETEFVEISKRFAETIRMAA